MILPPPLDRVRAHLHQEYGLVLSPVQLRDLPRVADDRLRATGVHRLEENVDLLHRPGRGGEELRALIAELTIGETSFFRHPAHFDLIAAHLPGLLRAGGRVRVWRAGGATGGEPYAIA